MSGTIGGPGSSGGTELTDVDFECLAVLHGHEGDVKCVEFASSHGEWGDGEEILLSASYDNTIKCWAEEAGDWYCAATIADVHTSTIWSLALSPSSRRLISASADGSLAIYKCYSSEERKKMSKDADPGTNGLWACAGTLPDAHDGAIYSVNYAPSGMEQRRFASAGEDGRMQVFRETNSNASDFPKYVVEASVFTKHGDINCVCWHPTDGSILCTSTDYGAVEIWKFHSQQ